MPALLPLIPIIQIDSGEARDLDVGIALQKIYYQPVGYQRNAKKLLEASIKTGYDFTLDEKAFTKDTMGITEKYNGDLTRKLFRPQDASNLLTLHLNKISRVWVKNLPIVVKYFNNFITCQLGISPDDAIVKEEVLAKPSYPWDGPIDFDEEKLSGDVLVRYLLYPSDLEGGRRCAELPPQWVLTN
ncbi:hypothetical protein RCL_jg17273.t2 [Rhizophagus clarus]|uniref:Uncharacterized protein n=1 Tax=Rhizophagus clarus TaxID=94130 RepID=A0A8H3KVB7_9GLOM|nr:hypothetical protein RCL_jg17273.t2 [Rhizophagus clarus]